MKLVTRSAMGAAVPSQLRPGGRDKSVPVHTVTATEFEQKVPA
jgi:hypothetical protein